MRNVSDRYHLGDNKVKEKHSLKKKKNKKKKKCVK